MNPVCSLCLVRCLVTSLFLTQEVAGSNNFLYKNSVKTFRKNSIMRDSNNLIPIKLWTNVMIKIKRSTQTSQSLGESKARFNRFRRRRRYGLPGCPLDPQLRIDKQCVLA